MRDQSEIVLAINQEHKSLLAHHSFKQQEPHSVCLLANESFLHLDRSQVLWTERDGLSPREPVLVLPCLDSLLCCLRRIGVVLLQRRQ